MNKQVKLRFSRTIVINNMRLKIYGYSGLLKLFNNLIRTKLYFKKCRLIRFPIEIRGKQFINFGIGLTTGVGCRIEAYPFIKESTIIQFGNNVEINDYVHIAAIESIKIGNNVLIASKVFITDITHGTYSGRETHDSPNTIPKFRTLKSKPVEIHDNVWIGENVSILPGVIIGYGAIIGANSVVTKSIPPQTIAVGNPAKIIKYYNEKTLKWEGL